MKKQFAFLLSLLFCWTWQKYRLSYSFTISSDLTSLHS